MDGVTYYKFDRNSSYFWELNDIRKGVIGILHYIPRERELANFTSHGLDHTKRVIYHLNAIIKVCDEGRSGMTDLEAYLLYASAWLHDIGCLLGREEHSIKSAEMIEELQGRYIEGIEDKVPFLQLIIRAHSRKEELKEVPEYVYLYGEKVKLRFIAALFRLADACDIDRRRAPKVVYGFIKKELKSKSKKYWIAHQHVDSVSFDVEARTIVIGVQDEEKVAVIIRDFEKELDSIRTILEGNGFPCKELRVISQEYRQ